MGAIRTPQPVLLIVAAFAAQENDLCRAQRELVVHAGPIALSSEPFCVDDFTTYYAATMGTSLTKQFWAFERLIDPASLASWKNFTNVIEGHAADAADVETQGGPRRLVNLDAGYVDLGKLVLASTKDHAHRIYLRDGIFAETTLIFTRGAWTPLPWTYPDYREPLCHDFLNACRGLLHDRRRKEVQRRDGQ